MNAIADGSRIVTFRLGGDLFAANILTVERVLKYELPRAIPNVPDWIEGVIEYQGRVVPAVDLRRRFGLPSEGVTNQTRMLIFATGSEWIAVMVDAVLDVRPVLESELAAPPTLFRGLAGAYLRGIVRRDEELVIVLDVDRLLASHERLRLEPMVQTGSHA
jgi:purine-binding chemotaxis protein CheW